jgi:electron transport complex protein RnfD
LFDRTAIINGALNQRPQVGLGYSSGVRMALVSGCAGLAVVQSSLTDSFISLGVAVGAVLGAVLAEFVVNLKAGNGRATGGSYASSLASALVFSLLLPNTFSPFQAFLGAAFGMLVIKYSFGGLGANWFNPALGAWLFVRCAWPGAFDEALAGSALAVLPDGGFAGASVSAGGVSGAGVLVSALNRSVFAVFGAELPHEYVSLLAPAGPGIIADRGLFCFLLGTVVITAFQVSRSWIPAAFLVVYGVLVRTVGAVFVGGEPGTGDLIFGLFSGGVMATAFLLTADPATGPKTTYGALAVAACAGLFAFVFRYIAHEPYGAFFAVVLLNTFVPLIRELESRILYRSSASNADGGEK